MRARGGRLTRRGGRVLEHRNRVSRPLRVVGESRGVPSSGRLVPKRPDERCVQPSPPTGGDGALEHEPRKLVAKAHPVAVLAEDAGGKARVELLELGRRDGFEERELRPARDERDDVEQPPRLCPELRGSRQHGIADRFG